MGDDAARQTQADAAPGLSGGEERSENLLGHFLRDKFSIVGNPYFHGFVRQYVCPDADFA